MSKLLEIFEQIKKDFCSLTDYKMRGETIEIVTPFSTMNNKFVSVFLKESKSGFLISDGGWIDMNFYEIAINEESEDIIERLMGYYQHGYKVESTSDKAGTIYYFKLCSNLVDIASCVYDMANFTVGVLNALGASYKDEKEEKERETFRKDANEFLRANYKDNLKLQSSLDDFKNIKFNALITRKSDLFLVTYITGSSSYYFTNDLRKTIVNFEISEKSKYNSFIKERISIINDEANGYHPLKLRSVLDLLNEKVSREPIKWTEKEKILDLI